MAQTNNKNSSSQPDSVVFAVVGWRLALRILTLLIMLALNYALLGSAIMHLQAPSAASLRTDAFSLLVLLFFNLAVLFPTLIQVSNLEISPEGMVIKTLLWKSKLNWADIKSFSKPATASFAILRAKKCLYLLARRDFSNFDELVRIIASRCVPTKH
jgi:hypothetical protein